MFMRMYCCRAVWCGCHVDSVGAQPQWPRSPFDSCA